METTTLLILLTNAVLVVVLGFIAFLLYQMIRQQKDKNAASAPVATPEPAYHPEALARLKQLEKVKLRRTELFCPNHPDEPGESMCAICDRIFCKACIRPFRSMHLCKEHLPLIMKHDWVEVVTIKTSTHDPEQGVRLYDVKKELYEKEDLPTYIETHYKINVDQDYVETYLVLYSMVEKLDAVRARIKDV